jgi:N6-adenosine-specific RNA methylase IME4
LDRAADNHYPTMTDDSIISLAVAAVAADDAVLYPWATVPMLPQALAVIEAWGFQYKSHIV